MFPLVILYWFITATRRLFYRTGFKQTITLPVPVIIVGNLTVGGNGKTPVVVWLVKVMQSMNFNVGVISRGYGGENEAELLVTSSTNPKISGDEPKLIVNSTGCLLVVGRNRVKAAELLIEKAALNNTPLDFIVSDDGLQHYRLGRAGEIIVIDGKRRFGNNYLLPMGPNREGQWRLNNSLMLINNGGDLSNASPSDEVLMSLQPLSFRRVIDNKIVVPNFETKEAIAMAGIGYPHRFFETLNKLNINIQNQHAFDDHQAYNRQTLHDLATDSQWLIMTEKDAVKCVDFALDNWIYLPVEANISYEATKQLKQKLEDIKNGI